MRINSKAIGRLARKHSYRSNNVEQCITAPSSPLQALQALQRCFFTRPPLVGPMFSTRLTPISPDKLLGIESCTRKTKFYMYFIGIYFVATTKNQFYESSEKSDSLHFVGPLGSAAAALVLQIWKNAFLNEDPPPRLRARRS